MVVNKSASFSSGKTFAAHVASLKQLVQQKRTHIGYLLAKSCNIDAIHHSLHLYISIYIYREREIWFLIYQYILIHPKTPCEWKGSPCGLRPGARDAVLVTNLFPLPNPKSTILVNRSTINHATWINLRCSWGADNARLGGVEGDLSCCNRQRTQEHSYINKTREQMREVL